MDLGERLDPYLDVLLALQDGTGTLHDIMERTGMNEPQVRHHVLALVRAGFADRTHATQLRARANGLGRTLLRSGFEESYKRALWERLGGDVDSAS